MGSDYDNEPGSEDLKNESDSESSATKLDQEFTTKIFTTLEQVKTPTAFAFSAKDSSLPNPALNVPPHGILGLPLWPEHAQKIISQARQSPFGKGEETLVDTTVRKSWELNPNQFSLKNPSWNKAIETIVDTVTMELGLGENSGKVSAELNKLLLYEPGAFFKPHTDSEKAPGMFATLIVCLPSPHEGGKLVMTHADEKYEFETASSSSFECSYAAWYSDITHEVLPVVSGYRLVLVYNLIRQADFEVPSHDLVRGHVKQLSTLLEEYNLRLEEDDDILPPILLHKLEHKYTHANLKLNALKPPDLAQVQVLKQLATKLGFDIYLATLVLEVKTDDDYDGTEFDERSQKLENLVELDGTLVDESVYYPDGALIDPEGQDEDEADESNHEGWSGNEGSPATYWYRDTVVALLPPSRQLHFLCNFRFGGPVIEPLFMKRMQELSEDPAQKPKLEQLCELALKRTEYYYCHWQESGSIPPYYQQAVTTALDLGRLDLFDEACKTTNDKIVLNYAGALGRWAANNGVVTMKNRLTKGVRIASPVSKKVEFLKAVAEGFETVVQDCNSAERASLKQWSDEAILTAVAELKTLTKDDAVSLAQLCKTIDWSLFESKTKPAILKAITMIKITFIEELMLCLQHKLEEKQRSFVEMIIRNIWNKFGFEANCRMSSAETYSSWLWYLRRDDRINKNILILKDILRIVKTTITILFPEGVETIIIPAMLTAIPVTSKESSKELFIFLVQMILKSKLAGFVLPTDDTIPPPSHKRLVQALLTKFLLDHVSPEPETPTDWTVPTLSCTCNDCSVVNRFLQNPHQLSLDFQCVERRRKHLDQVFDHYSGSFYDITTIRGTIPLIWRITKTRRGYETAKSKWIESTGIAKQTLSKLKNEELVSGRLEAYLEPYYNIIMNANIKQLPDLKSLVTVPQLSENNENAASALNQPTNETGLKRGVGSSDLPEDELAKRPRS